MTWRIARSLDVLLGEVNASAPRRSKVSDGSIGDAAHASRASDHNPFIKDRNGVGVVRARDFTDDMRGGFSAAVFAAHVAGLLGKHPALGSGAYVIWNHRIISTNRLGEGWRPYTGANPHTKHVHVSVGTSNYDNTQPWGWGKQDREDWFTMATKAELEELIKASEARIIAQLDKELQRDKNVKARDAKRHQRLIKALKGTRADVGEVLAALEDTDQ